MDHRLITQALQDTARKEISDDMNLYPEIQSKLAKATRTAAQSRTSWVVAAVLTMLALSIVAYAAARLLQTPRLDPGLQGASEADLLTLLGLEQSIDGVTVTLDYAYADANRISIGYHTQGETPFGTSYEFTTEKLTDSAGHEFQTMFGGGGGGGGSTSENPAVVSYSAERQGSYDVAVIDDTVTELSMRLEIGMARNVSSRLDENRTPQPVTGAPETTPIGPFVFEFTIPFIPGQVVEANQSVTAAGFTLSLGRLAIAPSMTRGQVCFDPAPEAYYTPRLSLSVDGEAVTLEPEQTLLPALEGSPEGCFDLQVNQSLYHLPGTWRLSIDSLVRALPVSISSGSNGTTMEFSIDGAPEILAQIRARLEPALQPYGIALTEADGSLKYSYDLNAGIDEQAVRDLVDDATHDKLPGRWVFSFDVPSVP